MKKLILATIPFVMLIGCISLPTSIKKYPNYQIWCIEGTQYLRQYTEIDGAEPVEVFVELLDKDTNKPIKCE